MNSLLVTITTVTLNSEATVARAIESVLCQSYPRIQYILKDGLSTDKTILIASSYKKQFEEKGYDFRIISGKDSGMYDALNQAIEIADGEIIGNVNSDDYLEPNAVQSIVNHFSNSCFDMAYANLRIINGQKHIIKKSKFTKFATTRHWNHPTSFFKASVIKKEKYLCQNMFDDLDLMLRIRKGEYKIIVIDEVLSNFVFGGMSNKKTLKASFKRIKLKNNVYRRNGFRSPLYFIDIVLIEFAKLIF